MVNGASIFILYKIILSSNPLNVFSVWITISSFTNIANISASNMNAVFIKYVPKLDSINVGKLFMMGISFSVVFAIITYLIIGSLSFYLFSSIYNTVNFNLLKICLKFNFFLILLLAVNSCFYSYLDSKNKIYTRNYIQILGNIILILVYFIFLKDNGIYGLLWATIIQNTVILTLLFYFSKEISYNKNFIRKTYFVLFFRYGGKSQIISFLNFFFEPTIKYFLNYFGNIEGLSYYEISNKFILLVRNLLVSSVQYLGPIAARDKFFFRKEYLNISKRIFQFTLISFVVLFITSPFVSFYFFDKVDYIFLIIFGLLNLGWMINSLSAPAYFSSIGLGYINVNLISHIIMSIVIILLGLIFGFFFKSIGIVISVFLSLILGSCYTIVRFKYLFRKLYINM